VFGAEDRGGNHAATKLERNVAARQHQRLIAKCLRHGHGHGQAEQHQRQQQQPHRQSVWIGPVCDPGGEHPRPPHRQKQHHPLDQSDRAAMVVHEL
jgi:hypothetical protein